MNWKRLWLASVLALLGEWWLQQGDPYGRRTSVGGLVFLIVLVALLVFLPNFVWQARHVQDMLIIKTLLYTGVRVSELIRIRLDALIIDAVEDHRVVDGIRLRGNPR